MFVHCISLSTCDHRKSSEPSLTLELNCGRSMQTPVCVMMARCDGSGFNTEKIDYVPSQIDRRYQLFEEQFVDQ